MNILFKYAMLIYQHMRQDWCIFLLSGRTKKYTNIIQCKCIATRFHNNINGCGSNYTAPIYYCWLYVVFEFIAGFNYNKKSLCCLIGNKLEVMERHPNSQFQSGINVIKYLAVIYCNMQMRRRSYNLKNFSK